MGPLISRIALSHFPKAILEQPGVVGLRCTFANQRIPCGACGASTCRDEWLRVLQRKVEFNNLTTLTSTSLSRSTVALIAKMP